MGTPYEPFDITTVKFVRAIRKSQRRRVAAVAIFGLLSALLRQPAVLAQEPPRATDTAHGGATITYRLPTDGPLPRTYRVTLAITDPKDPNWIVSTFVAGAPRTVTKDNQGRFTETWNGLDDNFMPVPAGTYGVKGVYMPARPWGITGELHTFLPRFAVGAGDSWLPSRSQERKTPWMWGAGFGNVSDVAIAPGGKAVFYRNYVEGSANPFVVDLAKPIGYDQIVKGYSSAGTAGGPAVATDGERVWAASWGNDEPNFIYRADQKPFGHGRSRYRSDVYVAAAPIVSLAAWRDPAGGRRFLYVAEAGTVDGVLTLDGDSAEELNRSPLSGVRSLIVFAGELYALHRGSDGVWRISRAALGDSIAAGAWRPFAALPDVHDPMGFKIGKDGAIYVSDLHANQVYKLDRSGRIVLAFGRAAEQAPGRYDDHVFMSPSKLGLWTDEHGRERLLVIERSGAGRISEWSTDGTLLRQWFPAQTHAVFGYAVDPDDAEHVYMATSEPASGSGLLRFRVDYDTGTWQLDAVWPRISAWDRFPGGLWYPKIINAGGHKYLAFARTHGPKDRYGYMLYRLDGDRWVPSAGLIPDPRKSTVDWKSAYWWHDANGDGEPQEEEYRATPAKLPAPPRYWGKTWLDDLSLAIIEQNGRVWRLAPSGFDAHGNPVYDGTKWRKLLTDPIFAARAMGNVDALHGGNEIGDRFNLDWASIDGNMKGGFYVSGYSGPPWPDGIDSTGRLGSQVKITRYVPNGKGGFVPLWRVGRKALGLAKPGEIYGSQRITAPINHILGVSDGNGLYHLFTDDGLYLDTLLVDVSRGKTANAGVYALGGELFNGYAFSRNKTGQVYLAMGRDAAIFFAIDGWTTTNNSFTRIATLPATVTIAARQIAAAPEAAVRAHGGAAKAKVATFVPATGGGPALDGSLRGWEAAEPIAFGLDAERRVEVRTMYDPDTLYLRWHVRLPGRFTARAMGLPERLFTDGRANDTVSLYIQGDPSARPPRREARPGDTRITFAVVRDAGRLKSVAVAFYPKWPHAGAAHPVTFSSAVGRTTFEHVQRLPDARSGYAIDADGKGFVVAAAIARDDIPFLPRLDHPLTTTVNFAATIAAKTKFWWTNADGSASTITSDEPAEARLYPGSWSQARFIAVGDALPVRAWLVSGPWGGQGLQQIGPDDKLALLHFFDSARYPPDDSRRDWRAVYEGPLANDVTGRAHRLDWRVALSGPASEVRLGGVAQLYFAATWIYSPEEQDVACSFLTGRQNVTSLWINGEPVRSRTQGTPPIVFTTPAERQMVHLTKGWNRVFARSYAVGYDVRLGMVLHGAPEVLWRIGQSPTPPEDRH